MQPSCRKHLLPLHPENDKRIKNMAHNHEHDHHDHCEACSHHEHEHEHHHEHNTREQLRLIIITAVLLVGAVILEHTLALPTWQLLLVYLIPYIIIGHDTLKEAAEGLMEGDPFNEHFLYRISARG